MSEMQLMQLSRSACFALLAIAVLGRVIFTERALPAAQPVPFLLDDQQAIFRTGETSNLIG